MSAGDATGSSGFVTVDRAGEVLGEKYRLLRLVGEGGMGAVYEAQHVVVKRRFAIKVLRQELAKNADVIARFRREAEAAGALESDHVAAVTDFGTATDGAPYLVMEYLAGESLAALLAREGPLPVPRAVGILLQVCRGLGVAHAAGIVHRDLKPDNLFVVRRADGSDLVKILDFGIAKLQSTPASVSVTRTGSALGTPFYMAPEQARGDKSIDHRADVYALGVILYELLSEKKPHPGDSYNAILAHILTERPAPLASVREGLPESLLKVVDRALAFEPKDRPQAASELARELAGFAGREITPFQSQIELRVAPAGAPTLASPDAQNSDGAVLAPRRRRGLFLALPVVAAAGAGAAWLALGGTPSSRPPVVDAASPDASKGAALVASSVPNGAISVLPLSEPTVSLSGSAAERSSERPGTAASSHERRVAVAPTRRAPPAESASFPKPAPARSSARGATFDPTNPYQ